MLGNEPKYPISNLRSITTEFPTSKAYSSSGSRNWGDDTKVRKLSGSSEPPMGQLEAATVDRAA
jgi:hypothetical protein